MKHISLVAFAFTLSAAPALAQTEITWWHAMGGQLGETTNEIAKRFNDISVALLPIGAFLPEWFMRPHHLSPSDALRAHSALNARTSIANHFGTFPLGDDGLRHSPERCMVCFCKTECLREAVKGPEGIQVHEERVKRAYN